MSNPLALAAVTAVLKDLLNDGLINHDISGLLGSNVTVSTLPPDRVQSGGTNGTQPVQLNLFLYMVTPNPGWRNEKLPSRDAAGRRIANPPLALDLHYLLTAYGATDFQAEILLGYAMHLLHETPGLTRRAIRRSLASPSPVSGTILPPAQQALSAAELAEQVELIKITPEYLGTEEISKLWTAMQTSYRPTVAYMATVVLIESDKPAKSALPVRERGVHVVPFKTPVIEKVEPDRILAGGTLIIKGQNLRGEVTGVRFGELSVTPSAPTNRLIEVTLPAGLFAGVNTVQVVHEFNLGIPPEPHRGTESNLAPFLLLPQITSGLPATVAAGGTLALGISPAVGPRQRLSLLVGDREILVPPRAETDPPAATVNFTIPADFAAGTYVVRVRVDGAESPLQLDAQGAYVKPLQITT